MSLSPRRCRYCERVDGLSFTQTVDDFVCDREECYGRACDDGVDAAESAFWARCVADCRCCMECSDVPCPGVQQGSICDRTCHCLDDEEASDG